MGIANGKNKMGIVKKMMLALIGGIVVGIGCLFLRENLIASGNQGTWDIINRLLFADITTEAGVNAIGIFFIVGKVFMNGLQLAIVPLVLVSITLALCNISDTKKLGRIAGKSLLSFLLFYMGGCAFAGVIAYMVKNWGFFSVTLGGEAVTEAATVAPFNPLNTVVELIPPNLVSAMGVNNRILSIVAVAVILGICINSLGEKAATLKSMFEALDKIINMFLNFLINNLGPVAIFCLISRTFAIYGIDYLKPAMAYMLTAIIVLLVYLVVAYPLAVFFTTGLNPIVFMKKIAKVAVWGFSTNSSAATLPLNTRTCEDELGCSPEATSFILPLGMTINMNGTAMMHMVAVTFIATAAGIEITPAKLVIAALLAICASAGTPAIPVAGTTMIFTVLSGLGFTSDAVYLGYALVVAINRPVEMVLLMSNVVGDAATNVIVSHKEGELNKNIYYSNAKKKGS